MLGADPFTHMRPQLVIGRLHQVPFKGSDQFGPRRSVQRLTQFVQRARRCNQQQFIELIGCPRRVELLGNQPCEFLFLHPVQVVPLGYGMMGRSGAFKCPARPIGTDIPGPEMRGRRVECMEGAKYIVGVRLHEARMLAVRDGDTKGQRFCYGDASLLEAIPTAWSAGAP